jgi:DNA primase
LIPKETVDKIIETSRIEEVVGDFVSLKRRGTSMIGLCPFHNERTPSFHVSVAKGIYKCFGCGQGGDSVRFIMEHEKATYPEALRYLANKYSIEVAEVENSPEEKAVNDRRESLYIVSGFAAKYFHEQMMETEEGKTIGLSYFKERGFRDDIIKKFELGYSPDVWDALTQQAVKEGYSLQFLEETGLTIRKDNEKLYDRFRGRVMFPIHSFTGRVIGFGGRTLKTDKAVPKYVNSPESDIYHKSNVLYGLFFAKKAIRDEDNCYLVEGYADVLSVHQAGVENVVASSGTSLTIEQIRLIGRFTKNITILYDGDDAGIKASLRGLDMILEEGLNVKVVLFPDGHDPDSYVQKFGSSAFKTHIEQNKKDFILYKTGILLKDAGNDPIKRAGIIREVVESIAKIPDGIKASVFVRECSSLLQIEERVLISELNKIHLSKAKKDSSNYSAPQQIDTAPDVLAPVHEEISNGDDKQEKEIIRLLLNYGHELVHWDDITDTYIAPYIISNLSDVSFDNELCNRILDVYKKELENGSLPSEQDFIKHADHEIADLAIAMVSSPYILSENWYAKRKIYVRNESENLRATILGGIFHLKKRKVDLILKKIRDDIQLETDADNQAILMRHYLQVKEVEKGISMFLGSVIIK